MSDLFICTFDSSAHWSRHFFHGSIRKFVQHRALVRRMAEMRSHFFGQCHRWECMIRIKQFSLLDNGVTRFQWKPPIGAGVRSLFMIMNLAAANVRKHTERNVFYVHTCSLFCLAYSQRTLSFFAISLPRYGHSTHIDTETCTRTLIALRTHRTTHMQCMRLWKSRRIFRIEENDKLVKHKST